MNNEEEIWAPAPCAGAEGRFEVSSLGRVRSVSRLIKSDYYKNGKRHKGRILACNAGPDWYRMLTFRNTGGGGTLVPVHSLGG